MLESSDVVAFVATTDADRARSFYQETLGLPLVSQSPMACVFKAHQGVIRVTVVERVVQVPYTVLGWVVADIVTTIRRLAERGVEFVRYEGIDQDKLGIWSAPGGSQVAWFKDPDGNTLSLTEL
jgi:catechol 2,3-dioxygenase-like lactoylglutathione lyase family enzyme